MAEPATGRSPCLPEQHRVELPVAALLRDPLGIELDRLLVVQLLLELVAGLQLLVALILRGRKRRAGARETGTDPPDGYTAKRAL